MKPLNQSGHLDHSGALIFFKQNVVKQVSGILRHVDEDAVAMAGVVAMEDVEVFESDHAGHGGNRDDSVHDNACKDGDNNACDNDDGNDHGEAGDASVKPGAAVLKLFLVRRTQQEQDKTIAPLS